MCETSINLLCIFVNAAHPLGGEPDAARVRALGLPTFGEAESSMKTKAVEKRMVQKEKEASKQQKTGEAPFVLSEALPVIPAKLVKRVEKEEFVDMADFLKDNMELERRRMTAGESSTAGASTTSRREGPDILSWLHSFSMFAAIVSERWPGKSRQLWAYHAVMISEARRCGGKGWLLYDAAFRQQISAYDAVDFSRINQSLYSTTFLAYSNRGQCCQTCMGSDHTQEECALFQAKNAVRGRQLVLEQGTRENKPRRWEGRRERGRARLPCFAWNDGRCVHPHCKFDHICSRCFGNHKKITCKGREEGERMLPSRDK